MNIMFTRQIYVYLRRGRLICLPLSAVLHNLNRLRHLVLASINWMDECINCTGQRVVTGGHISPPLPLYEILFQQPRRICTIYTFIHRPPGYILSALILCATAAGGAGSAQDTISASATVRIYSVKPNEISGISRLKQEPSISDIRVVDLSVIPELDAMFGAYANNDMNDSSIAEIKASIARLPRTQLQALADAQMNLFDLQTRYDVEIDDLPVVVFEQNKTLSLYKGNDVYQGFLRWQQSKR